MVKLRVRLVDHVPEVPWNPLLNMSVYCISLMRPTLYVIEALGPLGHTETKKFMQTIGILRIGWKDPTRTNKHTDAQTHHTDTDANTDTDTDTDTFTHLHTTLRYPKINQKGLPKPNKKSDLLLVSFWDGTLFWVGFN